MVGRKRRGTLALLGAAATAIVGQGEYFTYMHAHAR